MDVYHQMKGTAKSRSPVVDGLGKGPVNLKNSPPINDDKEKIINTIDSLGACGSQMKTSPKREIGTVNGNGSGTVCCAGCHQLIRERYMLKAVDQLWHEDCLKCSCCDCRLGEVGSTLFTKANLILCKRDYLRLFGMTGYCSACSKIIPAFEMVMRAKANVYHLECFACQQCNHRFCVGDHFYLLDNKILCEYDYEERNNMNTTLNYSNSTSSSSCMTSNLSATNSSTITSSMNSHSSLKKLPNNSLNNKSISYSSQNLQMLLPPTGQS